MKKRLKVMVHYTQLGIQRSPNIQADFIFTNEYLAERCDMIVLDQEKLPREIGHIKSIQILMRKIKMEKPDIVHIIGVKEGFHCAIAALLAGCKKRILITHGFAGYTQAVGVFQRMLYRWIIEPITLLLSTQVQCNSLFSYNQQMIKLFAKNKRTVVYNFLSGCKYLPEHIWRKKNKIAEEDFVVVTVGNMHSGKGYDILSKVINCFNNRDNVKFVVIGDGPLKTEFDKKHKQKIDNGKVYSLGKIPHNTVMQIMSESNVFVLPTRYETLGMVFAEAGQCGLPSIGTKVGAVSEIIKDGETGYLVNMDDSENIIGHIEHLLNNPSICKKMGEKARKHVDEMFSNQQSSKKIFEIYEK